MVRLTRPAASALEPGGWLAEAGEVPGTEDLVVVHVEDDLVASLADHEPWPVAPIVTEHRLI